VPVHVIPCIEARLGMVPPGPFANIVHASGYGSEAADLLGIPYDKVTQVALLPTAWFTGDTFKVSLRRSPDEVMHLDRW
jgi:hypothetical protein